MNQCSDLNKEGIEHTTPKRASAYHVQDIESPPSQVLMPLLNDGICSLRICEDWDGIGQESVCL